MPAGYSWLVALASGTRQRSRDVSASDTILAALGCSRPTPDAAPQLACLNWSRVGVRASVKECRENQYLFRA